MKLRFATSSRRVHRKRKPGFHVSSPEGAPQPPVDDAYNESFTVDEGSWANSTDAEQNMTSIARDTSTFDTTPASLKVTLPTAAGVACAMSPAFAVDGADLSQVKFTFRRSDTWSGDEALILVGFGSTSTNVDDLTNTVGVVQVTGSSSTIFTESLTTNIANMNNDPYARLLIADLYGSRSAGVAVNIDSIVVNI